MKKIMLCLIFIGILCSSFVFAHPYLDWSYDAGADEVTVFLQDNPPEPVPVDVWGVNEKILSEEHITLEEGDIAFDDETNDADPDTVTIDVGIEDADELQVTLLTGTYPDVSEFGDPLILGLDGNGGPVYEIPEFSDYGLVAAVLIIIVAVVALYFKKKK